MVQLNVLSGKAAGRSITVRRFPFDIGRADQNDLVLDDSGVWNRHLTLEFQSDHGIQIGQYPDASYTVNLQPVASGYCLRNGDIIALGAVRLQFWLAAASQRSLCSRELFIWFMLAAVVLVELILLGRLPH